MAVKKKETSYKRIPYCPVCNHHVFNMERHLRTEGHKRKLRKNGHKEVNNGRTI